MTIAGETESQAPEAQESSPTPHRRWYRLALAVTILLVVFVLLMLPLAIGSLQDVLGQGPDPVFDFLTGHRQTGAAVAKAETEATYINLEIVDLDVGTGLATLAVSGNRVCAVACPTLAITLVALDDDADQRCGLPPFATLTPTPDVLVFSDSVQLPVRGEPSLYPFDTYRLWLGAAGVATLADGTTIEFQADNLAGRVVTPQNREESFIMRPPVPIDPRRVNAATDPFAFLAVQSLVFDRPR